MALGFYTNWSDHHDTAGYSSLFRPPSPELPPELFAFSESSTLYDNCINQLFDPNYSNNNLDQFPTYSNVLPPITPADAAGHVFAPSPEFQVSSFSYEDPYLNHLPYSTTFDHHQQQHLSHFFMMEHPMGIAAALPPSQLPEIYQDGGGGATLSSSWYDGGRGYSKDKVEESSRVQVTGKQNAGGGGGMIRLSAQSMAARVRRRKISEKTQELGKLIPGGHKMNTAEMFQAAFKYIKFLQAQVGVLKLMDSIPEDEQGMDNGELMEALVTSTSMQEKLYSAEKCIVSKHFAETLAIN
ncbi:transcription factor bHLH83-like [Cynara cardunculus var. scolymus]|uniref:Myc-type, basic helix-loop-helix (BHLH) domain-containing protein n=1 Tax=Cynara cardunculus var. scolymus TaxID=59895 RepID=A0A118JYI9_CYNCS|nr:transcription factor bHLH83-like [Cynara cardunculus var. scolymus]KVH98022.1 Myc-type, basic helix-loop-helix (bHLH) domain-containing protein [Cynara cardunculus var. scolymus]